jgi:Domain of unknown function (DUF5666)
MKNLMQKLATGAVLSAVSTTLACNGSPVSGPSAPVADSAAESSSFSSAHVRAPAGTLTPAPIPGRVVGVIESIRGQQLVVAGRSVATARTTQVWLGKTRLSLAALQRGQSVQVDTTERKDSTLLATLIEIQF